VILAVEPPVDPQLTGQKFARLCQSLPYASVPAAICIPVDWFTAVVGGRRLKQVSQHFADLQATLGHDLTNWEYQLASLVQELELTAEMREQLETALSTVPGPWAVRSSSTVEDGDRQSHAGLHDSFLHIQTHDDVCAAVAACWRSFYSLGAVLGRQRAGDTSPHPRMAVIVQSMIPALLAGVAFSQRDHVLIEAVTGTADRLVSGEADAARTQHVIGRYAAQPHSDVVELTAALADVFGVDVDVEWAWDGTRVHLIQVRPITASLTRAHTRRPLFAWDSLYLSEGIKGDVALGACASIVATVTAKRSSVFRLAMRHRIQVSDGWILTINGLGLQDSTLHPVWWDTLEGEVVVDLGTSARQNIIPATNLAEFLTHAWGTRNDPYQPHTAILRRFLRGEAGAVTRALPDGTTVMEDSPSGLLAINRGLDTTTELHLPPHSDPAAWETLSPPPHWPTLALRHIAEFTHTITGIYPQAHVEWVIDAGTLYFVDYSVPKGQTPHVSSQNATVISPGSAAGPVLRVNNDHLTELSVAPIVNIGSQAPVPTSRHLAELMNTIAAMPEKPIIYAKRPYAILSLLIGQAAGFVFDGGSTLCHLAILLREDRIPAAISTQPLPEGSTVALDDGYISVIEP
jgi:hypothetical protein